MPRTATQSTHKHDNKVRLSQANYEVAYAKIPHKLFSLRVLKILKVLPKEAS